MVQPIFTSVQNTLLAIECLASKLAVSGLATAVASTGCLLFWLIVSCRESNLPHKLLFLKTLDWQGQQTPVSDTQETECQAGSSLSGPMAIHRCLTITTMVILEGMLHLIQGVVEFLSGEVEVVISLPHLLLFLRWSQ